MPARRLTPEEQIASHQRRLMLQRKRRHANPPTAEERGAKAEYDRQHRIDNPLSPEQKAWNSAVGSEWQQANREKATAARAPVLRGKRKPSRPGRCHCNCHTSMTSWPHGNPADPTTWCCCDDRWKPPFTCPACLERHGPDRIMRGGKLHDREGNVVA